MLVCTCVIVLIACAPHLAYAANGKLGSWGATTKLPLVPVTAALLPNHQLVMFSAFLSDGFSNGPRIGPGLTQTATMDLRTRRVTKKTVTSTGHDMFCPGTALLADGRLLVNGGSNASETSIYNSGNSGWARGPLMNQGRAYNADTVLMDGRVFTLGGSFNGGVSAPKDGEVWSPVTNKWRKLPGIKAKSILTKDPEGVYRADNHAWLFALGGQTVFHAGPSRGMHFFNTAGKGFSRFARYRANDPDAMNGNAVMFEKNKILTLGGATAYTNRPATANVHLISLIGARVQSFQKLRPMAFQRAFHSSVVLPNGEVVVFGGQTTPYVFVDYLAVLTPEIWNPVSKEFRKLAPMKIPRTYHSVALLLPNGKVFVGGGGLCNKAFQDYCPSNSVNHLNYELFSPPYLLLPNGKPAPRPSIIKSPPSTIPGLPIIVRTSRPCASFSIVRIGAITHSINNDQRRLSLPSKRIDQELYKLRIPSAKDGALPGYWLLFAMDSKGVPSDGKYIRIAIKTQTPSSFVAATSMSGNSSSGGLSQ